MIIKTKSKSIRFNELTLAMAYMLFALKEFNPIYAPDILIITSINDGKHVENSRHYKDEAVDIRSKNFATNEDKESFRKELESHLNNWYVAKKLNCFRVLLENLDTPNEHFHVQVRKGMRYT